MKTIILLQLTFILLFILPEAVFAVEAAGRAAEAASLNGNDRAFMAGAATLAVGLSCITSAYALGKIGSAALGAMSEKPEIGGRALVFLGMAEGIAIYGLIIAIMILNKI